MIPMYLHLPNGLYVRRDTGDLYFRVAPGLYRPVGV